MSTPLSFNANWYLSQNPDVAAAIEAGAPFNAYEHFMLYGRADGRSASPVFDAQEYLRNNADVAEAVAQGMITAWDHFELFGGDEGRSPTPVFNEAFYLQQNPDVAAAIEQGIISSAAQHFALFGAGEPRAINPVINLGQYINANPDLAEAAANGVVNVFGHLMEFGVTEGRDLGNGVSLADFSSDPAFSQALANGNAIEALARVESVAPFLPTFERPAGWAPPANTPIPVDFVPPAGSGIKLVVPPEVVVPDGVELPDTFIPVTPPAPIPGGGGSDGGGDFDVYTATENLQQYLYPADWDYVFDDKKDNLDLWAIAKDLDNTPVINFRNADPNETIYVRFENGSAFFKQGAVEQEVANAAGHAINTDGLVFSVDRTTLGSLDGTDEWNHFGESARIFLAGNGTVERTGEVSYEESFYLGTTADRDLAPTVNTATGIRDTANNLYDLFVSPDIDSGDLPWALPQTTVSLWGTPYLVVDGVNNFAGMDNLTETLVNKYFGRDVGNEGKLNDRDRPDGFYIKLIHGSDDEAVVITPLTSSPGDYPSHVDLHFDLTGMKGIGASNIDLDLSDVQGRLAYNTHTTRDADVSNLNGTYVIKLADVSDAGNKGDLSSVAGEAKSDQKVILPSLDALTQAGNIAEQHNDQNVPPSHIIIENLTISSTSGYSHAPVTNDVIDFSAWADGDVAITEDAFVGYIETFTVSAGDPISDSLDYVNFSIGFDLTSDGNADFMLTFNNIVSENVYNKMLQAVDTVTDKALGSTTDLVDWLADDDTNALLTDGDLHTEFSYSGEDISLTAGDNSAAIVGLIGILIDEGTFAGVTPTPVV